MLDALLYAVRDAIRAIGYDTATCEIMPDGRPPPRCGNFFAAVHGGRSRGAADNQLHEYLGFSVTLTMRMTVAFDRVADQQLARNMVLVQARKQGFDAKLEQLRALLHMNWAMTVLQGRTPNSANDNLAAWATGTVYGFVEPARYQSPELWALCYDEWFQTGNTSHANQYQTPDANVPQGVKSELRFDGARRLQPQEAGFV